MATHPEAILHAELDFLNAISQGPSELDSFLRSWSELEQSMTMAIANDEADVTTMERTYQAAVRIETLAQSFLELYDESNNISLSLQDELSALFNQLQLEDAPAPSRESSPLHTSSKAQPSSYIQHAHTWLLANLHNPYPSKEAKASLALQSDTSIKELDNWFADARRRIGWNRIRRTKFGNRRDAMVEAATRYLQNPCSHLPTPRATPEPPPHPQNAALDIVFLQLQEDAISLYPSLQYPPSYHDVLSPPRSSSMLFPDQIETSTIPSRRKRARESDEPSINKRCRRDLTPVGNPKKRSRSESVSPALYNKRRCPGLAADSQEIVAQISPASQITSLPSATNTAFPVHFSTDYPPPVQVDQLTAPTDADVTSYTYCLDADIFSSDSAPSPPSEDDYIYSGPHTPEDGPVKLPHITFCQQDLDSCCNQLLPLDKLLSMDAFSPFIFSNQNSNPAYNHTDWNLSSSLFSTDWPLIPDIDDSNSLQINLPQSHGYPTFLPVY